MQITKIVITGGPCAGKSTALGYIKNEFSRLGYGVLIIAETATEIINGGITPRSCRSADDYQSLLLHLQLEKEKIYEQAAKNMDCEKMLIICDRGSLDGKAYMDNESFSSLLAALNITEAQLRDSYDAVFHLVTAAKGARANYTTANNTARTETVEQAAELDDKVIQAWKGHPYFRIIDNSTDFEQKLQRLVKEIADFLAGQDACRN